MQLTTLKQLFTEDRAVSPVIGVILMVAITVILAAVIGTFVLGLGDDLQDQQPQASFSFDYEQNANDSVTVSHTGGDSIDGDSDTVTVTADGDTLEKRDVNGTEWEGQISAGISETFNSTDGNWDGETVSVNWQAADGSSSATMAQSSAPTA